MKSVLWLATIPLLLTAPAARAEDPCDELDDLRARRTRMEERRDTAQRDFDRLEQEYVDLLLARPASTELQSKQRAVDDLEARRQGAEALRDQATQEVADLEVRLEAARQRLQERYDAWASGPNGAAAEAEILRARDALGRQLATDPAAAEASATLAGDVAALHALLGAQASPDSVVPECGPATDALAGSELARACAQYWREQFDPPPHIGEAGIDYVEKARQAVEEVRAKAQARIESARRARSATELAESKAMERLPEAQAAALRTSGSTEAALATARGEIASAERAVRDLEARLAAATSRRDDGAEALRRLTEEKARASEEAAAMGEREQGPWRERVDAAERAADSARASLAAAQERLSDAESLLGRLATSCGEGDSASWSTGAPSTLSGATSAPNPASAPPPASQSALDTEGWIDAAQAAIARCQWVRADQLLQRIEAADPSNAWAAAHGEAIRANANDQAAVVRELGIVDALNASGHYAEAKQALDRASARFPSCMRSDVARVRADLNEAAKQARTGAQATSRAAAQATLGTLIALGQAWGNANAAVAAARTPAAGRGGSSGGSGAGSGRAAADGSGGAGSRCSVRELGGAGAGLLITQPGQAGYTLYYVVGVPPDELDASRRGFEAQMPGSTVTVFRDVASARASARSACPNG